MKIDKIKLYFIELILIAMLGFSLVYSKILNRILLSILLTIFAVALKFLIKKPVQLSIKRKKVVRLITVVAVLYVGIYYTIGIYSGFYKALHKFSFTTLYKYIIPTIVIIISSEYIRSKFISIETKLSRILNLIVNVLIDISLYSNLYGFSTLNEFLVSIGYLTFAAIASNLLYNYISKRYGAKPVIIYRLITTLYIYIIPITPDLYIFFRTFFRMLYPLLVYYILEDSYGNTKDALQVKKDSKIDIVSVISFVIMTLFVMLISCQFRFGALVIGSSSMKGSINKGDVIIYDSKINKDKIEVGDVLVFNANQIIVVHRVIKIENLNNEKVYYTKGDNNQSPDEGHITNDAIIGKVSLSVPDIGKPTIWLNEKFGKKKEGGEI